TMEYKPEGIDQIRSVFDTISLKGKVVMITGGAGGIGRSCAVALAELGADIALMDIPPQEEKMEKYCAFLREKYGVRAIGVTGDVSDEASVIALYDEIERQLGTVDVVFSNAGIIMPNDDNAQMPLNKWQKMLDINLTGMLLIDRYGAEMMKKHGHGGSIINMGSMSGFVVNRRPTMTANLGYTTTKAGVIQLTKAMAINYADDGIRFNSISPGYIESGLHTGQKDEALAYNASTVPLKRFGSLNEIIGAVIFLATDLSSYCLGTNLVMDGGYTIW
nr:SDR family oxidoreductase [Clostridia bacterium]